MLQPAESAFLAKNIESVPGAVSEENSLLGDYRGVHIECWPKCIYNIYK